MADHHDHHQEIDTTGLLQETDDELSYKIRPIELIKHNPTFFFHYPYDLAGTFDILGGFKFLLTAGAGTGISYMYFQQRLLHTPGNFHTRVIMTTGRLIFGLVLGSTVGYIKFGDRQRVHNAWVAERLKRRYPDSFNLTATDLWRYKKTKATQEYYQWQ